MKEENLLFIVSQPRAGSTYLQNLVSNNAFINTISEPWILLGFAPILNPNLIKANYDYNITMDAIRDYEKKIKSLNLDKKLHDLILDLYAPLLKDFKYVVDKTPRYWEILDHITTLFPNSRIIILKRNPIDVVKSIINTWNINDLESLQYYYRDLIIAPKKLNQFINKNFNNPNVLEVKYEDLIKPEFNEVERIYSWIGIPFSNEVLNITSNEKFKGKYGDPYQNRILPHAQSRPKQINKVLEQFIRGYAEYLGNDFLSNYGNYTYDQPKKTMAFNYYVQSRLVSQTQANLRDVLALRIKKLLSKF